MRNDAAIIDKHEIAVRDMGVGELPRGSARIAVKAIRIRGLDLNHFKGSAQRKNPYPLIMGHEVSGEVVELNAEGRALAVRDNVILSLYSPCGHCYSAPSAARTSASRNMPWTKATMAEPFAVALRGFALPPESTS